MSLHELVVSTTPEEFVQDASHELVAPPDDVTSEDTASITHPDQVDISHEEELHESLVAAAVQVVDPVDSVTIEQSWSDDVYKSGTHFVVFVYCFSSMVIPALDCIVRVSLVLFSCILDSVYPIVRLA